MSFVHNPWEIHRKIRASRASQWYGERSTKDCQFNHLLIYHSVQTKWKSRIQGIRKSENDAFVQWSYIVNRTITFLCVNPTKTTFVICVEHFIWINSMKGAEGSEHLKMKANRNDKENVCIFWGKCYLFSQQGDSCIILLKCLRIWARRRKKICSNATQKRTRSVT